MLTFHRLGPDTGTPLLIVHGLFGSARNWGVIAKRISATRPVVTVDMRNHGESPRFDTNSYPEMAADLAEVIMAQGGKADVVGHSMGGKAAMVLALEHAEMINRLVVADIAPTAYGHTQMPLIHAMQRLDLSDVKKRSDADALLAAEVGDAGIRAFLLQSLDLKTDPPGWRLNLDVLGKEMDLILGWPRSATGQFDGPTLFLSGGASDYVLPEHRADIKSLFPSARFAKIPGAGHWLHAEKPREFEAAVLAFLNA
ncbi:pimeloyl-ACP methyl ester carboxylesterase [Aliiruegeria haliotis]|uniref:Pimeloyl-ACP methyl ester carboxylesterase n=1 Tax=Aliiruegeria haliotis TaxID=1280846 RepID=A0A2T0RRE1_9RHOB|nr:alpha/beta fold hydrolase [Aliiruegeria haliotis]PRY23670.1 pimeloyl-ACP methyl ester carboxylesterase [Aliiruegeria haliotis]